MPTCARWGSESPEGFRFCGLVRRAAPRGFPAREARKVVAALFCDVDVELLAGAPEEAVECFVHKGVTMEVERTRALLEAVA